MRKITLKIDDREIEAEITDRDYKELTKPKKKGLWVPGYGEDYWYVGDNKVIYEGLWDGGHIDSFRLYQKNVFRTREMVEEALGRLEALGRIRKYIHENDMYFEPDWNNTDQDKYIIRYDHYNKVFGSFVSHFCENTNELPCFADIKHVEQVIKDCKEDLKIVFGID